MFSALAIIIVWALSTLLFGSISRSHKHFDVLTIHFTFDINLDDEFRFKLEAQIGNYFSIHDWLQIVKIICLLLVFFLLVFRFRFGLSFLLYLWKRRWQCKFCLHHYIFSFFLFHFQHFNLIFCSNHPTELFLKSLLLYDPG